MGEVSGVRAAECLRDKAAGVGDLVRHLEESQLSALRGSTLFGNLPPPISPFLHTNTHVTGELFVLLCDLSRSLN